MSEFIIASVIANAAALGWVIAARVRALRANGSIMGHVELRCARCNRKTEQLTAKAQWYGGAGVCGRCLGEIPKPRPLTVEKCPACGPFIGGPVVVNEADIISCTCGWRAVVCLAADNALYLEEQQGWKPVAPLRPRPKRQVQRGSRR